MYLIYRKKRKGFTLAEVLLTLTIIGVIASMTIPALIQSIQDAEFKVAWKKAYGEISQITMRIISDNGGTMQGICTTSFDDDCLRNAFIPYFNYIKSCDTGETLGNCFSNYTNLNGSTGPFDFSGLILTNGASLMIRDHNSNCSNNDWGIATCGWMYIDVNGLKEPNILGKDIFGLHIISTGTKPLGTQGDAFSPETTCLSSGSGSGCSALYLYN